MGIPASSASSFSSLTSITFLATHLLPSDSQGPGAYPVVTPTLSIPGMWGRQAKMDAHAGAQQQGWEPGSSSYMV